MFQVIESRMKWAGHVAHMGYKRCIQGFGGKSERRGPLGRPRHRWDDIKMDLQEVEWRKRGLD
jgi:hypothetical protein